MAVRVLVDSTSYIPQNIRKKLDIIRVSLNVAFDGDSFKETVISNEAFYNLMDTKGIPISSQPAIEDFQVEMLSAVKNGDSIICILMSSDMSGTYSTANMVKNMILEEYEEANIEIIDSRSNSMQLGFAAIVAARAAKEGKSLEEVKDIVYNNIKRSRFLFIPENFVYLKKGGRIGGASALIGNLLQIIPVLTVENGKTTIVNKIRTKKKAVASMVEKMFEDITTYGLGEIVVHHINCFNEAELLVNQIKERLNTNVEINICDIGPVIGLHVGPGAIGIAYYTEKDMR